MNQIVFAAGVLLFPAVCTTLGAAGVFLLRRSAAPRTQRVLSGMAAGIMLAASVWSLLLPAIERTRELGVAAWVPPSAGLVLQAFLPRVHLLRCRNIKWAKEECVLNQIVFAAGVLLFPAVCTTLGAAGVFLLRRSAAPRTQRVLSGMAAGIMLAASVWSLLLPAIERTRELGVAAWVPPSAGLVLGAAGLLRLESMAGQLLQRGKSRMVLAVTLHNLPEGMVVGLAAALALSGEPDAVSGALALSLGIGLQNIPEGAAVSLPLAHSGRTRLQAFGAGAASGLVEPLGALAAFALAGWVQAALPWLMSAAAGCMVCVTAQEMIPEAVEQDEPAGVVSIVLGFALMMALDVAL